VDFLDCIREYCLPTELASTARNYFICSEDWSPHDWARPNADGTDYVHSDVETEPSVSEAPSDLSFDLVTFALKQYYDEFPESFRPKFSRVRFNQYCENQGMKKHWDGISSLFSSVDRGIPVLSVVGLIDSAEEGGEFIFTFPDGIKKKFLKQNDTCIVFPSAFMYAHEVTPVIKGVRNSYVSWTFT